MLSQIWVGSTPNLDFAEKELVEASRFSYLGDPTSPGGHMSDEVSRRTQKT